MIPFNDMPPHSRVWIYQSSREFSNNEVELIRNKSEKFVAQWIAHSQKIKASIEIFYNRFIVICVDEKTTPVSGCGIDKSVKFIEQLEKDICVSLLNRTNVAYRKNGKISITSLSELKNSEADTVFNNLVNTKEELEKRWEMPIEESWYKKFL